MNIRIINMQDEVVYDGGVKMVDPSTISLEFPDLPAGLYHATVSIDGEPVTIFPLNIVRSEATE